MAKRPIIGAVKTRLAAEVGDEPALAVYEGLLRGTLDQAESLEGVELVLAVPPAPRETQMTALLAGRTLRWSALEQRGDGLGGRLAGVFEELFEAGATTVLAVGSDSPPIPLEYLRRGFSLAAAGRFVVGPAADGGYYLIGCERETWERHHPQLTALLRASPMSSPRLLTTTLRQARAIGLEPAQLPLWMDVDDRGQLGVLARLRGEAPSRGGPLTELREVYLHVTHRCARACRHCYDKGALRQAGELDTAGWKDAIDQCVSLGASSFVFIGGDPLLREDLVELVDHVTGSGGGKARFFFNSRIDARLAAALSDAGRGRLTPLVSIDGPRDINDRLRGSGSYDDVMASIATLQAAGLEPVANTVLVRPVLAGLPALARELQQAGVRRLHLILPHQQGLDGERGLLPSAAELLPAVRELIDAAGAVGLAVDNLASWRRRIGRRNDLCAAGCRDLAIDPYGNVHACAITVSDPAFVAGSLCEQDLATIWRGSASLRLLRASRARDRAACRACDLVDACGGECWVQAHYAARAADEPAGYAAEFPYCGLVRPILRELTLETDPAGRRDEPDRGRRHDEDYALFDCI